MRFKTNLIKGIILTALIIILFITCQKEKMGNMGFPRIRTLEVEMNSDTGAIFKGEIIDIPTGVEILDYGFVWSTTENSTSSLEKISLGKSANPGTFSANVNRAMVEGKTYHFKSYIQTSELMIYGNELEFVSLGSHAPMITSVSPSYGGWNDTITINGQYFSSVKSSLILLFNSLQGSIISTTENQIKVRVPADLDEITSKLSVKFANVIYPSNVNFTLVPNLLIQKLEPETAKWNDLIKIKGKNLRAADSVFFNNIPSRIQAINDTSLTVVVPSKLDTANANITVKVNSFKFVCPTKFNLSQGKLVSFSPSTGTFGTSITINARNVRTSTCKVLIGSYYATITYQHDSTLIVTTPSLNKIGDFDITIEDGSFKVVSQSKFTYNSPVMTGMTPNDAEQGDTLTLTGKDLGLYSNYAVSIGAYSAQIVTINDNFIKVIVPKLLTSISNNIYIKLGSYNIPCSLIYNIPTPQITTLSLNTNPTSLTINGKYLKNMSWIALNSSYLNISPPIKTLKTSSITAEIPYLIDGLYSLTLSNNLFSITKDNIINYSGPIKKVFTAPENTITSFRMIDNDDNSFYISGYLKDYLINKDSYAISELTKFLPINALITKVDRNIIYYDFNSNNLKKTNLDDFTTSVLSNNKMGYINDANAVSSNNNSFFFGLIPTEIPLNTLMEYNEESSWKQIGLIGNYYTYYNMFSYNKTLYLINSSHFYKYDNNLEELTKPDYFFDYMGTINNIGYFSTVGEYGINKYIYSYNFDLNIWAKVCSIPFNINSNFTYTKNNKFYLVNSSNPLSIIEFDPYKV